MNNTPFNQIYPCILELGLNGSAYVEIPGFEKDILIPPGNLSGAFDKDEVNITIVRRENNGRSIGKVVEIIKKSTKWITGIYTIENKTGKNKKCFVLPSVKRYNFSLSILAGATRNAKNGDKVLCEITRFNPTENIATGKIRKVLGKAGENETEMNAIIIDFGFNTKFPDKVQREANEINRQISHQEIKKRRDFRSVCTFTIDPVDAKDFDDALSIKKLKNGNLEIGIHIADPSYYVKEDSAIDKEAYTRSTSVYLVDRTIPMLPEILSNDVCSLNPNSDKLTYSAVFEIDNNAHVLSKWFGRTVIRSKKRFNYEEAQAILHKREGVFYNELNQLNLIAKKIKMERLKNGSLDFDSEEVKFKLDSKGKPLGVYLKQRNDTNDLIEEFMLLANANVAEYITRQAVYTTQNSKIPMVYRIHDEPDPAKLNTFAEFTEQFGYDFNIKNKKQISLSFKKLNEETEGKPEARILKQLGIRTMAKAVYSTHNIGHYGLAFPYYSHFTSPIRRYPDMMLHRILTQFLNDGKLKYDITTLEKHCTYCSVRERMAVEAERDSIKFKQAEYMQRFIGRTFDGIVSGITFSGLYVELPEVKCEGLLRLQDIKDDYYEVFRDKYLIKGRSNRQVIRLGDSIKVKVKSADPQKKVIEFTRMKY